MCARAQCAGPLSLYVDYYLQNILIKYAPRAFVHLFPHARRLQLSWRPRTAKQNARGCRVPRCFVSKQTLGSCTKRQLQLQSAVNMRWKLLFLKSAATVRRFGYAHARTHFPPHSLSTSLSPRTHISRASTRKLSFPDSSRPFYHRILSSPRPV